MARIFISYRRADTRWAAGRLYDRLTEALGRDELFFDVSDLEPGEDYVDRIGELVATCDVLLAVIGPNWVSIEDAKGRRLTQVNDTVRVEVGTALGRGIRVIPVLVDGADMPSVEELPEELSRLPRINAKEVGFKRFHADLDSFVAVLRRILGKPTAQGMGTATGPAVKSFSELPYTISLEILGGVAHPLLQRGQGLPVEAAEEFSTPEDNQEMVDIKLYLGEKAQVEDNLPLGTFGLGGIAPASKGVPRIQVRAVVDTELVLTVTGEDMATHRAEVLDAIDLKQLEVPPDVLVPGGSAPAAAVSKRDSRLDSFVGLKDLFSSFTFGSEARTPPNLDLEIPLPVSASDARTGTQATVSLDGGQQISVQVPPGVKSGTKLRLAGLGKREGEAVGDLFLAIEIVS